MKQAFTISEAIKNSWACMKENIWVLAGLFIGYTILYSLLGTLISPVPTATSIIASLLNMILGVIFVLGYYKNIFQALDGIEPQFSAYGQQVSKFFTFFIANIIVAIAVVIGCTLLLVPGIYLFLRWQFLICFIVEEDAGIIDSLKRSWAITEGHVMKLFLLFLAQMGIVILGLVLLIVGVFVAMPLVYTIQCYVFRQLNNPLAVTEEATQDM